MRPWDDPQASISLVSRVHTEPEAVRGNWIGEEKGGVLVWSDFATCALGLANIHALQWNWFLHSHTAHSVSERGKTTKNGKKKILQIKAKKSFKKIGKERKTEHIQTRIQSIIIQSFLT
jgi:hypothetical protein